VQTLISSERSSWSTPLHCLMILPPIWTSRLPSSRTTGARLSTGSPTAASRNTASIRKTTQLGRYLRDLGEPAIADLWDQLERTRQGAMYAYLTTLADALQAKDAWQDIRTWAQT
jgi:hypothetical protein